MTSRARNPGLLGLILAGAGAVSSFSGCNPFVAAGAATAYLLHNNEQNKRLADAQRESAQIQADAMRDAARVQAGNGNSNSGGSVVLKVLRQREILRDMGILSCI